MKSPDKGSEKSKTDRNRRRLEQIDYLKKTVILLIFACLAISACLNVYVFHENLVTGNRVAELQQKDQACEELFQFFQRFVGDLKFLARTNNSVAVLLTKYRLMLSQYGLDSRASGRPEQ